MLGACLLAFTASAVVDFLMTKWVDAVAQRRSLRAAFLSMSCAFCLLIGIGETLRDSSHVVAVAWVLGYGAGSWVAVELMKRKHGEGTS